MAGNKSTLFPTAGKLGFHRGGTQVTVTIKHPNLLPFMQVRSGYWAVKAVNDELNAFALIPADGKADGVALQMYGSYAELELKLKRWPALECARERLIELCEEEDNLGRTGTYHTDILLFPESSVLRFRLPAAEEYTSQELLDSFNENMKGS